MNFRTTFEGLSDGDECPYHIKRGIEMTTLEKNELKILKTFQEIGKPAGPKMVAEESGIPKDEVSKMIKKLKIEGYVMSPKRCFYVLDEKSKEVL